MTNFRGRNEVLQICKIFPSKDLRHKKVMKKKLCELTSKDHHLVCTMIFNVIKNWDFLQLTKTQKKNLLGLMIKNRIFFETLSKRKTSLKKKKQLILSQNGTGLIIGLLSAIIPSLVALLAR